MQLSTPHTISSTGSPCITLLHTIAQPPPMAACHHASLIASAAYREKKCSTRSHLDPGSLGLLSLVPGIVVVSVVPVILEVLQAMKEGKQKAEGGESGPSSPTKAE